MMQKTGTGGSVVRPRKHYNKPRNSPRHQPSFELEIWSPEDVMYLLNIGFRTLQNWESKKLVIPRRIGKKKWYLRSEIVDLLERHKVG